MNNKSPELTVAICFGNTEDHYSNKKVELIMSKNSRVYRQWFLSIYVKFFASPSHHR